MTWVLPLVCWHCTSLLAAAAAAAVFPIIDAAKQEPLACTTRVRSSAGKKNESLHANVSVVRCGAVWCGVVMRTDPRAGHHPPLSHNPLQQPLPARGVGHHATRYASQLSEALLSEALPGGRP